MRNFKRIFSIIGFIVITVYIYIQPVLTASKGLNEALKGPIKITVDSLPNSVQGLRQWYLKDQAYLRKTVGLNHKNEVGQLQKLLINLENHPDYRDSSGFMVYNPIKTGRIHLLAAAIAARKNPGKKYSYDELLGHHLTDEEPDQYPDPQRVIRLLKAIPMPKRAFEGFKVYLLPYSMGDANGYGGNGYAFLAAAPAGEALIANQIEVTLAHELGHHLHFRFMNRSTVSGRKLWATYLKIRDIPWKNGGEAGSKAWTFSSEEVFAEDFRVWEGEKAVGSGYFGDLAYPNPTNTEGEKLREFFRSLPANPMTKEENPWSDGEEQGTVDLRVVFPFLAMAVIGLPLVCQMNVKKSDR
ncbi:MAG TPA: hypothetical protein VHR47_01585 [Bacillota bacterium]|nr:hypothetical protein [Bacillota bacterium]